MSDALIHVGVEKFVVVGYRTEQISEPYGTSTGLQSRYALTS